MAIKLLRESSETPNITNKDDVRMIRYAYGGCDGIVKSYGEELVASVTGSSRSSLHIGSGRVVLCGWEADIDGAGVTLDFSHMSSGVYYYTVYLEVNAELETAEIKSLYDTSDYPEIEFGEDLTEVQSGTARIPLYHFILSYGAVYSVEKLVSHILYSSELIDELSVSIDGKIGSLEKRLDELGFKEGVVDLQNQSFDVVGNSLKRQGKYVLLNLVLDVSETVRGSGHLFFTVPEGFRPKSDITVTADGFMGAFMTPASYTPFRVQISASGVATIAIVGADIILKGSLVYMRNIGWETP